MNGLVEVLDAWWVPDEAIDACPLFAAVRATLVSEAELIGALEAGVARNSKPEESGSDLGAIAEDDDEGEEDEDELELELEPEPEAGLKQQRMNAETPMLYDSFAARLRAAPASVASAVLKRPILREPEARAKLAGLLRAQLAGYETSVLQDAEDLAGGALGAADEGQCTSNPHHILVSGGRGRLLRHWLVCSGNAAGAV